MKQYRLPALLALMLLSIVPLSQAQDHYGPVRRGQDLWDIARQVTDQHYKDANVSHTQVMLALLAANPSAFTAPCNANSSLHEGVLLSIPTIAQVQSLNPGQAQQQFDRQRQQWEEARQSGKPLVCPPVTATPPAPVVQEAPATQAAAPAPVVQEAPATQAVAPAVKEAPAAVKKPAVAISPVEKPGAKNWLLERQPRVDVELEAVAATLCGLLLLVILFWRRFRRQPVVAAPTAPPGEDVATLSVADTLGKLQTESATGLTAAEAGKRLQDYGPNALEEKKVSLWQQVMPFFWGPMPWMIEAAALMAVIVHDWVDFSIILVLLFFNAGLGFFHERAAANALDALKSALAQEAQTLRDGKWQTLLAKLLVPGDIVRIRLGHVVPADVKLVEGDYLDVDQSALTGESLPVAKKAGDVAYAGSIVKKGEMTAAVFGTGSHTFFGRTAGLVQSAGTASKFAEANDRIGDFLIILAVSLAVIMVASQLHHGGSFLRIAEFALLLLVAAIPVAMPAVLSMTMAMGAKALAREKAIVARLDAIEELAGIDILFSDKTGTLTQNKLTLGEPVVWGNATAEDVILAGALASKEEDKDPIDLAVIQALKDPGVLKTYQQVAYVPFDPVTKRTEATIQDGAGQPFKVSKGMPPVIFQLTKMTGDNLAKAEKVVNDFAAKGYRALAAARTDASGKWVMLGILPMFDPPRTDSKDIIARAQQYGVMVKMVTGDDVAIGQTIATDLGLGGTIVAATDLFTEGVGKGDIPLALARRVEAAPGFGRVFPEHKWAIIKSAQQLGHLVGMTGDGVNDAPALKQANVGIAVSGATEAARAAASLILTEPGLSVIIHGIEEARRTFERMMGYAYYRIAMTIALMVFVVAVMVLYQFPIVTPVMIILLALLDDMPVMLIAFDNAKVTPRPARWNMEKVLVVSSVLALLSVVQSTVLLWYLDKETHLPSPELQTAMFMQLVIAGHLLLFATRSSGLFWQPPFPEWKFFWAIMGTQAFAAVMAANGWLVTRIEWSLIGWIWLYNLAWLVVMDLLKLGLYCLFDWRETGEKRWQQWLHKPLHAYASLHRR